MSARPTWKGVLQISLVTIPIKVYPATESADGLSFNQLHTDCQTRVSQKKWCASCNREVPSAEIVKGFEFEKGQYVVLLPEELDAVQPPSTRVIDLVQFVDAGALDPLYIDRSYFVAPDGPAAGAAFVVMRDAMASAAKRDRGVPRFRSAKSGVMGIGKLAIYGREYLVAVRPHQELLMLHTLHHAAELRPMLGLVDEAAVPLVVDLAQVRLARQILASFTRPLNLAEYSDAYRADLQRLIDAKVAGDEIAVPVVVDHRPTANLAEALKLSLQARTIPLPARKKTA